MFKTEQEKFWYGEFGNDYIERNIGKEYLCSNISFFSKILQHTNNISSIIEFGANVGMNLLAIRELFKNIKLSAVEINSKAASTIEAHGSIEVYNKSILEFEAPKKWDMTLIKGVLIHINPQELNAVYEKLYDYSNKYILIAEYYNPSPVEVSYRGFEGKLFKRDFAGEMLDKFTDLKLVDYGFVYHRDNNFPQDDITWFLLEK